MGGCLQFSGVHLLGIGVECVFDLLHPLLRQGLPQFQGFKPKLLPLSRNLFVNSSNVALQLGDRVGIVVICGKECKLGVTADDVTAGVVRDRSEVIELIGKLFVLRRGPGHLGERLDVCGRMQRDR